MTSGNKKVAAAAISRIRAGGGTNLSAGLFRGVDHHQQSAAVPAEDAHGRPQCICSAVLYFMCLLAFFKLLFCAGHCERVRSVFLFTDGCSSCGLTDIHQLTTILSAMLRHSISPKIYTFGFGNVVDDTMLNALSEEGNGQAAYIEDAEVIPEAFASALGGLMSMAAQNLELTFSPKASFRLLLSSDIGMRGNPLLTLLLSTLCLQILCSCAFWCLKQALQLCTITYVRARQTACLGATRRLFDNGVQERASLCRVETSFRNSIEPDGSIKVAVGDMLAGEQKDFLVELELPTLSTPDVSLPVLELHSRYLDVCNACMREVAFQAQVLRTADTAGLRTSHPLVLVSPADDVYLLSAQC